MCLLCVARSNPVIYSDHGNEGIVRWTIILIEYVFIARLPGVLILILDFDSSSYLPQNVGADILKIVNK